MKVVCTVLRGRGGSNVALLPDKAARGIYGQIYPWGNGFDASKANTSEGSKKDTTPIGSYEAGKSPYGAYDMSGNVWEWCADWYDQKGYQRRTGQVMKDPVVPSSGWDRLLRGGSFANHIRVVRVAHRLGSPSGYRDDDRGFRCGLLLPPS